MERIDSRAVGQRAGAEVIRVSPFVLTWARVLGIALAEVARASSIPLERLESLRDLSYGPRTRAARRRWSRSPRSSASAHAPFSAGSARWG